ncbi:hypothetical protein TNCV_2012921 [Trichonephila clavipes]|uniref:Uncharacterized protein n=1 Tax=Trichonephila clavipes TaxID=2585209 RepID=A0A8X6RJG0_TRICX|nr:hypothetical protein TNCV_2012921 [Trichonephila clavipes]
MPLSYFEPRDVIAWKGLLLSNLDFGQEGWEAPNSIGSSNPPQIPVKKIDSQRRSRERRPRDPGRVFRRPPYAHRFRQAQVFFHTQGLAMLCLRDNGFTLTNGVV